MAIAASGDYLGGNNEPRPYTSWVLLCLFVALWVGVINLAVDNAHVSASEGVAALRASTFRSDLPAGVALQEVSDDGSGVAFADIRKTPTAEGGAVVVGYVVMESEAVAEAEYEEGQTDYHELLRVQPQRRKLMAPLEVDTLPTDAMCFTQPYGASCDFVVGNVDVTVTSRLPAFVPGEDHHIEELSRAAYEHVARVLHV